MPMSTKALVMARMVWNASVVPTLPDASNPGLTLTRTLCRFSFQPLSFDSTLERDGSL